MSQAIHLKYLVDILNPDTINFNKDINKITDDIINEYNDYDVDTISDNDPNYNEMEHYDECADYIVPALTVPASSFKIGSADFKREENYNFNDLITDSTSLSSGVSTISTISKKSHYSEKSKKIIDDLNESIEEDLRSLDSFDNKKMDRFLNEIKPKHQKVLEIERQKEKEKKIEELKEDLIADITELMEDMDNDGINIKGIDEPTTELSLEQLNKIKNKLNRMQNSEKYAIMGSEIFIGLANVLELAFNGKRKVPLLGNLDYTGYHTVLQSKLRKSHNETANLIEKTMAKVGLGETAQLFLKLLPSFLMYPINMKKQNCTSQDIEADDIRDDLFKISESS